MFGALRGWGAVIVVVAAALRKGVKAKAGCGERRNSQNDGENRFFFAFESCHKSVSLDSVIRFESAGAKCRIEAKIAEFDTQIPRANERCTDIHRLAKRGSGRKRFAMRQFAQKISVVVKRDAFGESIRMQK